MVIGEENLCGAGPLARSRPPGRLRRWRDEGVPRGRGRPPHNSHPLLCDAAHGYSSRRPLVHGTRVETSLDPAR